MRSSNHESLRGPRGPMRGRRLAAAGLLAASSLLGAACSGDSEPQPEQPDITVKVPDSEGNTLRLQRTFETHGQTVDIVSMGDIQLEGTNFSVKQIEKQVKRAATLPSFLPSVQVPVGPVGGSETDSITASLSVADAVHGFIVVENQEQLGIAVGGSGLMKGNSATGFDMVSGVRSSGFLIGREGEKDQFGFDANDSRLYLEACNNMVRFSADAAAIERLMGPIPANDRETSLEAMNVLLGGAVCRSYALALAAREAEMVYEEYSQIASQHQKLDDTAKLGLDIYHIAFPEDVYAQLGTITEAS